MFYIFVSLIIIIIAVFFCYEIKIHNIKKINNNLQIMLAVKNYDNDLINIIKDDDVKGIIINIADTKTIEKLIKNIKENLNKKIFIALDEDYKPTHNLFFIYFLTSILRFIKAILVRGKAKLMPTILPKKEHLPLNLLALICFYLLW